MRPMPILVGVLALVAGTLALRPLFVEAAVGGIVHDEGTGHRPDPDPGRLGSEGAEPRPVATSVREPLEAPAGHTNRPAGQALRIRVVDSKGNPVAGQAAWEFCDGHPLCGLPLDWERGSKIPMTEGKPRGHAGHFDTDAVVHRVELEPATRLQVRWRGEDALMRGPTHLVVTSRHGSCARVQAKVLAPVDGRRVAMRLGTCVVPRGPVQVDCVDDTTGESLWTRDVMAKETWLDVDV